MTETYKVWVCVEECDEDNDCHRDILSKCIGTLDLFGDAEDFLDMVCAEHND
jgi:hypothetical protein